MAEYETDPTGADLPFLWEVTPPWTRPVPPMDIVRSGAVAETDTVSQLEEVPIVASERRLRAEPRTPTAAEEAAREETEPSAEASMIARAVRETVQVVEPSEPAGEAVAVSPEAAAPLTPYEAETAGYRARLFERVGHLHDETGIRTDEVKRFLGALGLQPAGDALVIDKRHKGQLDAALKEIGFRSNKPEVGGYYQSTLGLSVIFKDPTSDPARAERTYAHERGHSTSGILNVTPKIALKVLTEHGKPLRFRVPLDGFMGARAKVGSWLEEGFARWVDMSCVTALGPNPEAAPPAIDRFAPPYFPDRYRTGLFNDYRRYAALGFDVLFAKDPELMDAVLASRSDPGRMTEVRARINEFHPALFGSLMKIRRQDVYPSYGRDQKITISRENNESFRRGLGMVLGSTRSRWEQLPELSDAASQQVQAKLREYEKRTASGPGRPA